MARPRSYDSDYEHLPVAVLRALSVDRAFYQDAACRNDVRGTPKIAWTAESDRKYLVGANLYTGKKLIELALQICEMCPVQWECARTAIDADERAGVWGARLDDIRWLGKRTDHVVVLEMAKSTGVSVQATIRMERGRLT